MQKPKLKYENVYLSYSFTTNPSDITNICNTLNITGVNIKKHIKGHTYSINKLASCDLVIVVPPDYRNFQSNLLSVGKGQYTEAEYSMDNNIEIKVLTYQKGYYLTPLRSIFSDNPNSWKKHFGSLQIVPDNRVPLLEYLGTPSKKNNLLML